MQNYYFSLKLADINRSICEVDYVVVMLSFPIAGDYWHISVENKLGCNISSITK